MQTFPEKIAETGSAGHPFVAFDMALWMHFPLVNSQFCFSLSLVTSCLCFQNLLSWICQVLSLSVLMNHLVLGMSYEEGLACLDWSKCLLFIICLWGAEHVKESEAKQFLFALIVVHHLSVRIWACVGVQVKQFLFAVELVSCYPLVLVFWQSERENFGRSSEWWHQRGLRRNVICSVWISGCTWIQGKEKGAQE